MPETLKVSFDKEKLREEVENAIVRVGRAGAAAIVDAADRELAKLQGFLGVAKQILKPPARKG
jgi:hypothetical protein